MFLRFKDSSFGDWALTFDLRLPFSAFKFDVFLGMGGFWFTLDKVCLGCRCFRAVVLYRMLRFGLSGSFGG